MRVWGSWRSKMESWLTTWRRSRRPWGIGRTRRTGSSRHTSGCRGRGYRWKLGSRQLRTSRSITPKWLVYLRVTSRMLLRDKEDCSSRSSGCLGWRSSTNRTMTKYRGRSTSANCNYFLIQGSRRYLEAPGCQAQGLSDLEAKTLLRDRRPKRVHEEDQGRKQGPRGVNC